MHVGLVAFCDDHKDLLVFTTNLVMSVLIRTEKKGSRALQSSDEQKSSIQDCRIDGRSGEDAGSAVPERVGTGRSSDPLIGEGSMEIELLPGGSCFSWILTSSTD